MSVTQISVFVESKPGHLRKILNAFEEAHISVRGYSASDTGDYGIARFVLDRPDEGIAVLKKLGSAATTTEVLCVKLEDRPGELARVFGVIAEAGINVVYSYSLISTFIALKVDDLEAAQNALSTQPLVLVDQNDLREYPFESIT